MGDLLLLGLEVVGQAELQLLAGGHHLGGRKGGREGELSVSLSAVRKRGEGGREGGHARTLGTSWSSIQLASGRPVWVHSLLGLGLQGCSSSKPRGRVSWAREGREGGREGGRMR
jgi:hypothetical protein